MDYILNKEEFIESIERLRTATDAVRDINHIIKINNKLMDKDFMDGAGMSVSHQELVIKLMAKLMHDKENCIDYFVYEMDFGRDTNFAKGYEPDFRTAEELYGYLIERY